MCISIYSASQLSLFETPTFISHTCSTRAHIYMLSSPHSSIVMDMNGANSSICRDTMHALHRNLVYIPPPSLSLSLQSSLIIVKHRVNHHATCTVQTNPSMGTTGIPCIKFWVADTCPIVTLYDLKNLIDLKIFISKTLS